MAGGIKGITVKLGGDTTELGRSLKQVETQSKSLQSELRGVNTLLKMDPGNVTLLTQKQKLLTESIDRTKSKLTELKTVQSKVDNGDIKMTAEEYRNLEREIANTEVKLKGLETEQKKFGSVSQQSIAAAGTKLKSVGDGMQSAGKKMLPATAAIGAIGVASVKTAASFDESMSQVAATMGMTTEEINNGSEDYKKLETAARDMGAATKYSASEAADALNYLALAGYDTDKSIKTLPTVLNLAAAGGMELATASDMVTDAMSALGLSTNESESFVDKMAKTSQKSNTSVAQLGEGILTVGGTAKMLKGGTTELNTQLGILANNGIKGAEGGTALRNILLSLSAPTKNAAGEMESLGLKVFDAQGNMRSTNDIFKDLNGLLADMNDSERTKVLSTLFNKRDLKSANALLANAGDGFTDLASKIDDSKGAAGDMADTMQNNLNGQVTKLKSALSEAGISIGQALMPMMKSLTGIIQSLTDKFNNLSPTTQRIIIVIAGIVAAIGPVLIFVGKIISSVGTIMTLAPTIVSIVTAIKGAMIGLNAVLMANPIILIVAAVVAVIAGLVLLYKKCEWFRNGVNKAFSAVKDVAVAVFGGLVTFFTQTIPNAVGAVVTFFQQLPAKIGSAISSAVSTVVGVFSKIRSEIFQVVHDISGKLPTGFQLVIQNVVTIFQGLVTHIKLVFSLISTVIGTAVKLIQAIFSGNFSAIPGIVKGALGKIGSIIKSILSNAATIVINMLAIIINFFRGLISSIGSIFKTLGTTVVSAWKKIKTTFVTKAKEIVSATVTFFKQLPGKIASAIQGAIGKVTSWGAKMLSTAKAKAKAIVSGIVTTIKETPGKIASGLQGALSKVTAWGSSMKSKAVSAMKSVVKGIKNAFTSLPGHMVTIGKNIIDGVKRGVTGAISGLYKTIKNALSGLVKKAKNALGIHSPSRVFRDQVGKWIPAGIASGIDEGLPVATDAVQSMNDDLTNQANALADATISRQITASVNGLGGSIGSMTNSNGLDMVAMKEVIKDAISEMKMKVDDREVARLVRKYA